MDKAHLSIENLTVRYGKTVVVDSFSLEVDSETVVLFGPSGCGKTTILKAILGVSEYGKHVEGNILFNDKQLMHDDGYVGMVFQGPIVPSWMTVSALCRIGSKMREYSAKEQNSKIEKMLNRFGISNLINRYPYQLSGGQKQRVALAVTLLNEPSILLMDEPSTFIDGMTRIAIWDFLEKEVRTLGIPTIVVSHDPAEAIRLADKIYCLSSPAAITRSLDVPFAHPRNDSMLRNEDVWELRNTLISS